MRGGLGGDGSHLPGQAPATTTHLLYSWNTMYRICTAMLLRAYALTTGLRKDRKVLTTVVMMTRQVNWGLGEEGRSCGTAAGRVLGGSGRVRGS